jgi:hypothetical protein
MILYLGIYMKLGEGVICYKYMILGIFMRILLSISNICIFFVYNQVFI